MSTGIPVNPEDLPIEAPYIEDTSAVYNIELIKVIGPKSDKNSKLFFGIMGRIVDGDYEGLVISKNYIKLPVPYPENAKKKDRIQVDVNNSDFGRFARVFKPRGTLEALFNCTSLNDSEAVASAREYLEQCLGNVGPVTVENSEFPVGSGKMRSAINDFVV